MAVGSRQQATTRTEQASEAHGGESRMRHSRAVLPPYTQHGLSVTTPQLTA